MTEISNFVPSKDQYDVMKDILGCGAEIIGLLFPKAPEAIAARRTKNLISVIKRVQNILDEAGLKPEERKAISLKLGLPIIENASLEEDPSLQELWANLLANALNPDHQEQARTVFIDIIKDLTAFDVLILNAYHCSKQPIIPRSGGETAVYTAEGHKLYPSAIVNNSLAVLKSLGLLTDIAVSEDVFLGNSGIVHQDTVHLTPLGVLFVDACMKDASK